MPRSEKERGADEPGGDHASALAILVRGLSRAVGGATVFVLPMLMTSELWELGAGLDRFRIVLLYVVSVPLLVFISHYSGFERTFEWREDLRDTAMALGIGLVVATLLLILFGAITLDTSFSEVSGKIALQTIPASLGALLARTQFGGHEMGREEDTYGGELGLMTVGALFLAFNIAPTEEVRLISYRLTPWHGILIVLLAVAAMHAFVYASAFKGGTELSPDTPWWSALLRFTLVGYVISVAVSAFILWIFGSLDAHSFKDGLMAVLVLAFPAAIGAAAARLIL